MLVIRILVLLLFASIGLNGCVSEPELANREDAILDYYMPRSTEYRYLYSYGGWSSGKPDSLFHIDYFGRLNNPEVVTMDGHAPIHQYTVSSTDGQRSVDIDLYVSDSVVVEYGKDCSLPDERFIPLSGRLRVGSTWPAAKGFRPTPEYSISFHAEVKAHYNEIMVDSLVKYQDVWQVNYVVSSSPTKPNLIVSKEYLKDARRVIYFARGIGKVYEIAYSPQNEIQWENKLLRIDRR
jgi:hypothetical protein